MCMTSRVNLGEEVLPGNCTSRGLVLQQQPGVGDGMQQLCPDSDDLWRDLRKGIEGAKGDEAELQGRQGGHFWSVDCWSVTEKTARQSDQLLHKGLLSVPGICNLVCQAIVHGGEACGIWVAYPGHLQCHSLYSRPQLEIVSACRLCYTQACGLVVKLCLTGLLEFTQGLGQ